MHASEAAKCSTQPDEPSQPWLPPASSAMAKWPSQTPSLFFLLSRHFRPKVMPCCLCQAQGLFLLVVFALTYNVNILIKKHVGTLLIEKNVVIFNKIHFPSLSAHIILKLKVIILITVLCLLLHIAWVFCLFVFKWATLFSTWKF